MYTLVDAESPREALARLLREIDKCRSVLKSVKTPLWNSSGDKEQIAFDKAAIEEAKRRIDELEKEIAEIKRFLI